MCKMVLLMVKECVYMTTSLVKVRGPGVERSLSDPKVVGSNPGGAEIGLHDFHDPQK